MTRILTGWCPCLDQNAKWPHRPFNTHRNIGTPNRQRKSLRDFSKPDVSVWETYCTRITHCTRTCTQALETFENVLSIQNLEERAGLRRLAHCTLFLFFFFFSSFFPPLFYPPVVRRGGVRDCNVYLFLSLGRAMWCCEILQCAPLADVRSCDMVLWDTPVCTSLCRQIARCCAMRHCNVHLSFSSSRMMWCCETL